MNLARRKLFVAGGALTIVLACAVAIGDEAPVPAEKPDAPKTPRVYGPVPAAIAPAPAAVVAAPSMVGDYQVGHIHEPALAHLFWYSGYHPFLDELHEPYRAAMYNGAHARYYAGYRTIYTPNWNTWYVPRSQCYAPGGYGYDPYRHNPNRFSVYGPPAAGTQHSFYGPGYFGAAYPGGAFPVPGPGAAGAGTRGFRYTGEPSVYSPYGVGSASYFGAYGSAGQ